MIKDSLCRIARRPTYFELFIWLFIFLFSLFIILLLQLVILPMCLPAWHAGSGLLINGDWIAFHHSAVSLSEAIREEGWSRFDLRPNGWFPAGVASLFYTLITPLPLALAPLNAAIHATTALICYKLMLIFSARKWIALLSSLPYVLFPSTLLWYGQIHRDGYNILGMLLLLYGFIKIAGSSNRQCVNLCSYYLLSASGIFLIWLVRPHALNLYLYATIVLLTLTTGYYLTMIAKNRLKWYKGLVRILLPGLVVLLLFVLYRVGDTAKYELEIPVEAAYHGMVTDVESGKEESGSVLIKAELVNQAYQWDRTRWLPDFIDRQLYSMAVLRSVEFPERYGKTASAIDFDISFHRAIDYVLYLPRALQIAFFAPFPSHWVGEGSYAATTFFRRVTAFEMLFVYLSLPFCILSMWFWRRRLEIYLLVLFCFCMMLPIVYSVPNVGTVYRYRYGYLMILACLGFSFFLHFVKERWSKRRKNLQYSAESSMITIKPECYLMCKIIFDLAAGLTLLLLFAPAMIILATIIVISMGRPVLFRQQRPGLMGKPFNLYKFRTMISSAESQDSPASDVKRLTKVGRFLRKYSLDELPQLFNVVKGELSFVGPRPLLMQYIERYTATQNRRHEVKPGITGWAQVNGRNAISWEDKFKLDVWYVDNHSFLLDLKILGLTLLKVIRAEGISSEGSATMHEFMGGSE